MNDTVRLRSKHAEFRVRNVQFSNHVATVSRRQCEELEAAAAEPLSGLFFGPGGDFWRDDAIDGVKPVLVTPQELAALEAERAKRAAAEGGEAEAKAAAEKAAAEKEAADKAAAEKAAAEKPAKKK